MALILRKVEAAMGYGRKTCFWHNLCTLHAGMGEVHVLLPEKMEDIQECLALCHDRGLPPVVVGAGTNITGSDIHNGCMAIRLPASPVTEFSGNLVKCSTGALALKIFRKIAMNALGGAVPLSGIPGTLGGMLKMNAGANGMEICETVVEMEGIAMDTGKEWHWYRGDGGWGYRTSPVPENVCLTSAVLEMEHSDSAGELAGISSELERRRSVTPSWWSAGSVFRNPPGGIAAGKILEDAGCKGLCRGPFKVSGRHANWIVNESRLPGAAAHVHSLIEEMKRLSPVPLQCEIRYI